MKPKKDNEIIEEVVKTWKKSGYVLVNRKDRVVSNTSDDFLKMFAEDVIQEKTKNQFQKKIDKAINIMKKTTWSIVILMTAWVLFLSGINLKWIILTIIGFIGIIIASVLLYHSLLPKEGEK